MEVEVAKNLLLGQTCNNCNYQKLKYNDQWDDRDYRSNVGELVCVNIFRELCVTDKAICAWPYPEEGSGIMPDERGTCEFHKVS